MTQQPGPLHELTFSIARESAAAFERWLKTFIGASRDEHRIVDCRLHEASVEETVRTCQFQIEDDRALDELLDGFFAEAEAGLAREFGDNVTVSSRTLREESPQDLPALESPDCLNCGTRLRGQYCGICGQRARSRLISLWELVSEAFGDLLELDSRLWRTLIPLLRRPGHLTRDYLEGRRARYMPPFRTYLVLSLIFFVVAFFDPRDDLGLLFEPEPEPTPEEQAEQAAQAEEIGQRVRDELAEDGIIVGDMIGEDGSGDGEQVADGIDEPGNGFNIQIDDDTGACNVTAGDISDLPEWFQRRFTPERLGRVCERVTADKGKTFAGLLLDNIPIGLIVLLPVMALVLKILYPLSRRYFVEHLLFLIHFHAFFFLILTLEILFARVTTLLSVPDGIVTLTIVAASFYIPVYLYLSMRRVYGQGRILTFLKYIALLVAYSVGATTMMLGAVFFALAAV